SVWRAASVTTCWACRVNRAPDIDDLIVTLDGSSYIARQGDGTAGHKGPKRRTGTPWPRRDQGVAVRMTNGRVTIRPVHLGQQRLAFGGDGARQKTAGALAALAMQKHESL